MKAQSSIEFTALLTLTLLASSLLLTELNQKASSLDNREKFEEARKIGLETSHYVEMVETKENFSVNIDYSSLQDEYSVLVNNTIVQVSTGSGLSASFRTQYSGDSLSFDTSESVRLVERGGDVEIE